MFGLPKAPHGDYHLSGFTVGTRIATDQGWRPVEALAAGDRVLTFDHGAQTIAAMTRGKHLAASDSLPAFAAPVDVPAGAIGNDEPMVLMPEQPVLVESDAAEAMRGDPFALLPAKALVGFRGIERFRALRPVEVITLHCENDELVFVDGGALMLAPSTAPGIAPIDQLDSGGRPAPYVTLRGREAEALVAALAKDDSRRPKATAFAAA
ncbi:hypothetical protein GCM10011358_09600 [Sinisalibacter lacisalsi]|uniref:Hedgehog/Intein (Hint) domain-containing protein n=2 Tax=Sinisalibacter lacisalsi TaxID=1526570 RepID=A0ABQ1QHK4_9RHOB|nr:hypothetical protein GCM10011358_09600 [Sinisalibacter lacisalsi]